MGVSSTRDEGPHGRNHKLTPLIYRTDQPAAALWTYYTNETCRPTSNRNAPCTLGYYGIYVILAKTYEHVKAGVDFARTHDLRLVIRNTGHDFLGRSTGWGALVINTHGFKDATFISSYTGPGDYHGSAVIVGAGIQGGELLKLGSAQDPPMTVVVGECSVCIQHSKKYFSFCYGSQSLDCRTSRWLRTRRRTWALDDCERDGRRHSARV